MNSTILGDLPVKLGNPSWPIPCESDIGAFLQMGSPATLPVVRSPIIILLFMIACGCGKLQSDTPIVEPRIVVCTTVYPLADVVRQVGGEHVKLDWIIDLGDPLAGYTLNENDRHRITGVDFLVCNGSSTDGWAFQPLSSISGTEKIISLEQSKLSRISPAIGARWLDPVVVKELALTLADKFSMRMPKHKSEFFANADKFIAKLDNTPKSSGAGAIKVIVTTSLFDPLLDRTGVKGVLVDVDPLRYSAAEMDRIKMTAQKEGISAILLPFDTPPGTVADIEARTGLQAGLIDLLGKPQFPQHASYEEMLLFNLQQLK